MPTIIDGSTGVTFPAGGIGNPAGTVVGTTDTQTLINKTISVSQLSGGASGLVLTSNGVGVAPTWESAGSFAAGTVMLFAQTSAPTGWTKDTTNYNNSALRVVTGSASTGGSVDFSTAFASQAVSGTVGSTTLTESQIPSHRHQMGNGGGSGDILFGSGTSASNASYNTAYTGGGGSHNHSFSGTAINLAVKYVDVIRATKD